MGPIIVATDFSATADSAMRYGAQLAQDLRTDLLLLHTYQMPVTMSDMPVMMISAEELKRSADKGLDDVRETVLKNYSDINVHAEARMGDLVDELAEYANEKQPLAIVLGSKGYKGIEKLMFGNTPLSVIRNSKHPVITVPDDATAATPKNVVLATDLQNNDDVPVEKILELVRLFTARLHVLHVIQNEDEDVLDAKEDLMQNLSAVNPIFQSIVDEDVVDGVQKYVQDNDVDLLLVIPHKHNLYERIFFRQHTEGLISKSSVPVLCVQKNID